MKIITQQKLKLLWPWIALYLLVMGGAGVWAAEIYKNNNEHRLPPGEVELVVSKTRYQLGETIEFRVINHFPVPIFVTNNCPKEPLDVYEWKNDKWVQLHDIAPEDSECYSQERNVEIPSNGSRNYNFNDWPNLFNKPGVYRIATTINHSNEIPFQDFVVLEPAKIVEIKEAPITPPKNPIIIPAPKEEPQIKPHEEQEDREREDEDEEDDD